jgi:hypothetical protein
MYNSFDVCVLARHLAITGTLDPVRSLTELTWLFLYSNSIGGMSVRTSIVMVVSESVYGY